MRHVSRIIENGDKSCTLHTEPDAAFLLIQPVDSNDSEELERQITYIESEIQERFIHAAIHISKWNAELTPWAAPPVFGKIPFGEGAADTLLYIKNSLLPALRQQLNIDTDSLTTLLGGYSLAGLFSLWAAYQPATPFRGIAAASPSVWFPGWLPYATAHAPRVSHTYLSLGDKEERTKTQIMSTVSQDILRQQALFTDSGIDCKMEWNVGNHFQDNGIRMGKGFLWLMEHVAKVQLTDYSNI
ncbi:MAG: hypothetical protein K6A82_05725 [Prevotella sp.]|nr:hypothetical protein [Prevotella sp.]